MFGNKFTPENLQNSVLNTIHPSVRARVACSSSLQFGATSHVFFAHLTSTSFSCLVHYHPYNDEGANILTGDGKRPGSTPDDHVTFKFTTQLSHPTFTEGSHYIILNSTGRALSLYRRRGLVHDLYLFNLPDHPRPIPRETLFVCIISG